MFQSDIYPPTNGLKPGVSAAEWFDGKTAPPPKISLESVYEGEGPKEVPTEYKAPKPSTTAVNEPPKAAPAAAPAPQPVAARGPAPSMSDNKASLASQANKFVDKDEESEDETSSFEEVSKPVERPTVAAARQEEKTRSPTMAREPEPRKPEPTPAPARTTSSEPTSAPVSNPAPTASGAAAGLKDYLADIKSTLLEQKETLQTQNQVCISRLLSTRLESLADIGRSCPINPTRLHSSCVKSVN
jgi:coronin-1B/1C/6